MSQASKGSFKNICDGCNERPWSIVAVTFALSVAHSVAGIASVVVGILSSMHAEVWMAHRVSPIWSGSFYLLTAVLGILCTIKRTPYLVMCFGAFGVVSTIVAIVCIQLLRLGLVNHLSDGDTHIQEKLDILILLALGVSGLEILLCIITLPISCKMASKVQKEINMRRDGTFSIQVLGDKDIIIVETGENNTYERLHEEETLQNIAAELQSESHGHVSEELHAIELNPTAHKLLLSHRIIADQNSLNGEKVSDVF